MIDIKEIINDVENVTNQIAKELYQENGILEKYVKNLSIKDLTLEEFDNMINDLAEIKCIRELMIENEIDIKRLQKLGYFKHIK